VLAGFAPNKLFVVGAALFAFPNKFYGFEAASPLDVYNGGALIGLLPKPPV
jgi:hypothetical protein